MQDYGWLSLLPALTSLALALATRKVLLSLAAGVFLGGTLLSHGNPLAGLLFVIEQELFVQIAKPFNSQIIFIMFLINGFVALIEGSGAVSAFARTVSRSLKGSRQTQMAAWIGGLGIFFTDSGNSLILGPIFQPLFRQAKVCKEKLAYILDTTSAPDCVLVPFIGWGIYSMSLIQAAYESIGLKEESFITFVSAIPFQFYPILTLLAVPLFIITKRDFGLMARFQKKCETSVETEVASDGSKRGGEARSRVVLIPMIVLFMTMLSGFLFFYWSLGSLPSIKIRVTLMLAYLFATAACVGLIRKERIQLKTSLLSMYLSGLARIVPVLGIILLAWSLGDICSQAGTGRYLSSFIDSGFPPFLFPVIIFVVGAVTSFATGTSWGTFGILMPIALPIAHEIGAPMLVTIGAVLSGGVFGDHCSPISDTTIIASMGSDCILANHVNTQIPYAVTAAVAAAFAFLIAGMHPDYWVLPIGVLLLLPVSFLLLKIDKLFRNIVKPS